MKDWDAANMFIYFSSVTGWWVWSRVWATPVGVATEPGVVLTTALVCMCVSMYMWEHIYPQVSEFACLCMCVCVC